MSALFTVAVTRERAGASERVRGADFSYYLCPADVDTARTSGLGVRKVIGEGRGSPTSEKWPRQRVYGNRRKCPAKGEPVRVKAGEGGGVRVRARSLRMS